MKLFSLFFIPLALALTVTSCFKEDEIIPAHQKGGVITDTIAMTDNYRYQVYFDLSDSAARKTNPKTLTDIGFQCGSGAFVILNTADFMKAWDLGVKPFGEPYDTAGAVWKFDKSDGNTDSLAIGRWYTVDGLDTVGNGHLFIVNRGMDENGNDKGIVQMIIDSLSGGIYYFRWAKLDGTSQVSASVPRTPDVSYNWYSFSDGGTVQNAEPEKSQWDLLFTQYTTLLFTDEGAAYPYLVTGVLLNRNNVQAAMDTTHTFEQIDLQMASQMQLSSNLDVIGWEWKKYSFETGGYTVLFNRNYIIRDPAGIYFKMRFVSFYNSAGQKGYPVIEYQAL